jgi:cobalt-zinc-cadmium efflux system protein
MLSMGIPFNAAFIPLVPEASIGVCGVLRISMKMLSVGSKKSFNIKGAFLEVVSDMLSSVAVIIAGVGYSCH